MENQEIEVKSFEDILKDDELEDIMVNGPGQPVYVYHSKKGMIRTNLILSEKEILDFILNVAEMNARKIDEKHPFLDATLDDGSRFNATIPPASPLGPTITIRKFKKNPLSIVDLIKLGTITPELAAFLWTMIEGQKNYPCNLIVIGGTGSGKTTTLNALFAFIPPHERIVCLEDTFELNFFDRENVVRLLSKRGLGAEERITMDDLLRNTLRMRPDRIIVGEVRGPEAQTLFNAMNVGHTAMGTLHANSPGDCKARLTNDPMNVPDNMLPLMDFILLQKRIVTKEGHKRKVVSLVEVVASEVGISFGEIFAYDPKLDETVRTGVPSMKEENLAKLADVELSWLRKQTAKKAEFLRELVEKNISDSKKVNEIISSYSSTF
ncbi:MAG: ATPase, T2SS/T4P/T4SS family [archaeon]